MSDPHDSLDRRFAAAKQVADAVLYEGYVLYPYRASARKNQLRWQFGVLAPRSFAEADSSETCSMQTQIIVEGGARTRLHLRVRALQVQSRTIEVDDGSGGIRPVATLEVGGDIWTSFDEAVEHHVDVVDVDVDALAVQGRTVQVDLPGGQEEEAINAADGSPAGRVVRRRWPVSARVVLSATWCEGPYPLARVTIAVENATDWAGPATTRDEVVRHALVAVHTLIAVDAGRCISLLDPPEFAAAAVASCVNTATFPVLITEDVMLSSPIILYDHPAIAPESEGDMFDATEIDEILALRVLTLTDEEKREARGTDPRSAAIIDRCDTMSPSSFEALHGTFRSIRPAGDPGSGPPPAGWWDPAVDAGFDPWTDTVLIGSAAVGNGTRVRLRPSRRADAQDLFVAGRLATVAGVFHDVDDEVYLAVVVDDDPAAELHQWHGRYLYFHLDEVEVGKEIAS